MRLRRFALLLTAGLFLVSTLGVATAQAAVPRLVPRLADPAALHEANCTTAQLPAEAFPIGTGPCPGVRPGALVSSDVATCTLGFMFSSGSTRYMSTAGHCILDGGEQSWPSGTGPAAYDGAGNQIGRFVYGVLEDPKDFSLIELDPGVQADAQMCHFGGPTGINASQTTAPVLLQHYGNGDVVSALTPARSHLALGMPDADQVYAYGAGIFGDSGSAVISSDGGAVGILVTIGVHPGSNILSSGTIGITRLAPQVARAESVLGISLSLVTASLL
ncbi:MAG: hypothetical protein ACRDH6_00965 [Actinomycetota bacterium]